MTVVGNADYVEVYVWLPKEKSATFGSFGIQGNDRDSSLAKIGHVAIGIFEKEKMEEYISLWPAVFKKVEGGEQKASILQTFEEDQRKEKGPPTSIIRLHKLNIPYMLAICQIIKRKVDELRVEWALDASPRTHVDHVKCKKANSATIAYTLLRRGGFCKKEPYNKISQNGPARTHPSKDFYTVTRCHFGGSNSEKETLVLSPIDLLRIAASGACGVGIDLRETTKIMNSDRVETINPD